MKTTLRLWCVSGIWAISSVAIAQTVALTENFDTGATDAIGSTPPSGWTTSTFYSDGTTEPVKVTTGSDAWLGWKFLNKSAWNSLKTSTATTKRGDFALASSGIAVLESDGLRAEKVYSAALSTPNFRIETGKSYNVSALTHYRQGQSPQTADITISFDTGAAIKTELTGDVLNQEHKTLFTAPVGATQAKISWTIRNTSNNWYWALDQVKVVEQKVEPEVPFDPSALPKTTLTPSLTVGASLQNPGTSHMSVMFETTENLPTVWVRKAGSSGPFSIVKAVNGEGNFKDASIFFGDLKNLDSNTLYEYAVVTGTSTAPKVAGPYQFKTWPKESDGVAQAKFAVVSDTQDGISDRFKNIVQGVVNNDCAGTAAHCAETLAGFMVPGDLVASGNSRSNWRTHFFTPLSAIAAYVPIIPAPGNHEYFGEQATEGQEAKWALTHRKYFNRMPANGSAKHPLHWFNMDYLGLRIIGSDFNPASAMHNTGGWTNYDNGRGLFRASYMQEHLNWFTGLMAQTYQDKKPYLVLLNHHPCLSEKWRQGEVMAACDFIAQMEDYGRSTGAITANLNGHVHFYERGNSMNSRHLWLNVASGSGGLESAKQDDDTDLDVIANTKLTFGYGTLNVSFGQATPSMEWKRYDLSNGTSSATTSSVPDDAIRITSEAFAAQPQLPQAKLGQVDPSTVQLRYDVAGNPAVYEAQWQVSKDPAFGTAQPVFDIWGNDTRRENWTYVNNARVNTQNGVDISSLQLGQLLANPKRTYPNVDAATKRGQVKSAIIPGGNSLLDRWSCAYKWDENGDTGTERQGGRQCFARLVQADGNKGSAFDPFQGQMPAVLAFGSDERWYYRVRVRDAQLNWSDWSGKGSFEIGNPSPEPVDPPPTDKILIEQSLPSPANGLPAVALRIQSTDTCQQADASTAPVPDGLLPASLKASTGLVSFTLANCSKPGLSAQVSLTLPAPLPANAQAMKVSTGADGKKTASPLTGATIVGNILSYTVTDGGPLDEDGQINAAIVDPVLVAVPAAVDPNPVDPKPPVGATPTPVPANHPLALLLVTALLGLAAAVWGKRHSR